MSKIKITEEEAALRRINIFKNRHRQFIYVRKWRKKAYVVTKDNFRFIGYYHNRIFLVLLFFMFTLVMTNTVWPIPVLGSLAVWGIAEALFEFLVVRHYSPTKMPENEAQIGFVASALYEDRKIVNIKIASYFVLGIAAIVTIVYGKYTGVYLVGMIGISIFGFFQAGFYLYIQNLRKKGK